MWRTSSSRLRAAALLLAGCVLGCATLSVDQERRLGEEFQREVRSEFVLVRDETVNGYVADIGRQLVRVAGPQAFEYDFAVIEDPEINAFAGPAGHIYLNTGTILQAKDVSELAGVIAHEVGHVAERHVAENYSRSRTTGLAHQAAVVVAGVLGGQGAAGATNLLGGVAGMTYLNTFGREAEREADAFAVDVLPRAGYDPMGLVTFFGTLQKQGGAKVPAFLSSHPTTDERIETTRRMILARSLPPGLRRDDGGRLEIIQRRIRLLTGER